jgi:hypothetical protein
MPEQMLQPCAYHVVRYQPNLIRDEWVNIGVLLFLPAEVPGAGPDGGSADGSASWPAAGRVRQRWLDEPADLLRLRRLHPAELPLKFGLAGAIKVPHPWRPGPFSKNSTTRCPMPCSWRRAKVCCRVT